MKKVSQLDPLSATSMVEEIKIFECFLVIKIVQSTCCTIFIDSAIDMFYNQ
jgi:hypothetical protein